jgi:hypothetical protein
MKRLMKATTCGCSVPAEDRASELKAMSDSVTAYYDSLTDKEIEEDRRWGEFAASQMGDWS